MNRKWIVLLLALILALSVCGCAADKPQTAETTAAVETRTAAGQSTVTDEELTQTAQWLMEQIPQPTYGSVGGEWAVFGLARSGVAVPKEYFEVYGENVAAYTAEHGGVLHAKKYTEYSRVILAWTALGKDATDVGGFNLLVPLADFDQTVFQGINGPIFALLALDSGAYDIPENTAGTTQATRDGYVDYILNAELPGGGWSFAGGDAETDITAMAVQALAPYADGEAASAVDAALAWLAAQMTEEGLFAYWGQPSAESSAQVVIALCSLGIDPAEDERFAKNGTNVLEALCNTYRRADGSYAHTPEDERGDFMATEQVMLAFTALWKLRSGAGRLYDMTAVPQTAVETAPEKAPAGTPWLTVILCLAAAAVAVVVIVVMCRKKKEKRA